jgi:hypothetical protein
MKLDKETFLYYLRQAIAYQPADTKRKIIYRSLYYIKLAYYKRTITEKYPLDKHRADHYGLKEGSYRQYTVYDDIPRHIRLDYIIQLCKYYKEL